MNAGSSAQTAASGDAGTSEQTIVVTPVPETPASASVASPEPTVAPTATVAPVATVAPATTVAPTATAAPTPTPAPTAEPVAYIIKEGDTLIGICIKTYGSDSRVAEVCSLNQITNPDNIKIGQKILLP